MVGEGDGEWQDDITFPYPLSFLLAGSSLWYKGMSQPKGRRGEGVGQCHHVNVIMSMSSCQCHEYFPQFSAGVKIKDGSFDVQRQGIWRKISNKELLVHLAR